MADPAGAVRPPPDTAAQLEALRARGAASFDPAGLRFIEALAQRGAAHRGASSEAIDRRLQAALADFCGRFAHAEAHARAAVTAAGERFPDAGAALGVLLDAGRFGEIHRRLARLEARGRDAPLAGLVAPRPSADPVEGSPAEGRPAPLRRGGELRAVRDFRGTWSRLKAQGQVARALSQAPRNAGPLNSEFLVLQAFTRMRDIAPAYLEQFVPYVDTLLRLERPDPPDAAPVRGTARRDRPRKPAAG